MLQVRCTFAAVPLFAVLACTMPLLCGSHGVCLPLLGVDALAGVNRPAGHALHCTALHCTAQQFCCPIADTTVVSSVTPPLSYGSHGVRLLLLGGEAAEGGPADAAAASAGMQVVLADMQQRKAAGSMCYSTHA
jgi:hypothetical protein